jgi:small subunit ribosomal protein S20
VPQHKAYKKSLRQDAKRKPYNRAVKSTLKTATKKFLTADAATSDAAFVEVTSTLDLAARKGVIPKKRADRKKSRLAKALNKRKAAG